MKTHLHSPFFYKLQNNFVYFDLKDQRSRVYYRYLEEYYRILADKITHIVLEKINDRLSFFKRPTPVSKLDLNLLKDLRGSCRKESSYVSIKNNWSIKPTQSRFTWSRNLAQKMPLSERRLSVATLRCFANKRMAVGIGSR